MKLVERISNTDIILKEIPGDTVYVKRELIGYLMQLLTRIQMNRHKDLGEIEDALYEDNAAYLYSNLSYVLIYEGSNTELQKQSIVGISELNWGQRVKLKSNTPEVVKHPDLRNKIGIIFNIQRHFKHGIYEFFVDIGYTDGSIKSITVNFDKIELI